MAAWAIILAGALLATLPAVAQDHPVHANQPDVQVWQLPAIFFHGSGTLGDFDGDHLADFAIAQPQGSSRGLHSYHVDVHLSAHPSGAFDIQSQISGGLHVATMDVDGDHDLDLVITTEFGRQPVGVWINDGNGAFFQGDSAAYPRFIWQQSKHFFEQTGRPAVSTIFAGLVIGGWDLQPTDLTVTSVISPLRLHFNSRRTPQAVINPSSPFRAPPLL